MKIAMIAGTRPEYLKIAPVIRAFKDDNRWQTTFVATGQHDTMLSQLYDFFDLYPDYDLQIMQPGQSLEALTSRLLEKLSALLQKTRPDYVLIQGDTTTTLVASLAAYYRHIPVLHLEAGLRTDNKFSPFPEEVNRRLTSTLADYHFCPTDLARDNLYHENIRQQVYVTGNTIIDSLLWTLDKVNRYPDFYRKKFAQITTGYERVILITAHRRESFGAGLGHIVEALKQLATEYANFVFVFPVHLNPQVKDLVQGELGDIGNIALLPPQDYDDMVYLMSQADLLMTDSGGIQEEAPTLGKPVLVMRPVTERPEAAKAGFSILCGTDTAEIVGQFRKIIQAPPALAGKTNPYGNGRSAQQIKDIMDKVVFG